MPLIVRLCATALFLLILGRSAGSPEANPVRRFYIGTYTSHGSKGIYSATFDMRTGAISTPNLAAPAVDPSFLALHPQIPFLYAVNEGSNQVSSFSISPGSGELKPINQVSSGGGGPCHLALDASGRMLIAVNYGGGSFSSFPVSPDGQIGTGATFVQFAGSGPNPKRQESPHAHFAYFTPDNRFSLITDLGTDRIMVYRVHPETAVVDPADPPFARSDPGAGPRHLTIGPDHRFAYVLNEVQSSVTRFAFNGASGALRGLDTVSSLPPGFHGASTAAEIVVDPQGHWLLVSNRGDDSLVVFHIDSSGALHQIQRVPSGGRTPRSFTLDPSSRWLLAANQDSNNVCVFRIDPASGRLSATATSVAVSSPVCLLFGR